MSDHLQEALRRYEAGDYARQRADDSTDLLVALHETEQANVQATLEVAEHVEYAGDQLRRLADAVEAIVEVVRERLAADADPRLSRTAGQTTVWQSLPPLEPCGHLVGTQCRGCDHAAHHGSACLAAVIAASGGEELCRCRFDEETATQAPYPGGPLPPRGESGVSRSPDGCGR